MFGYRVEIEEEATRAWYAQAEDWNCPCGNCQNFLRLARERKLPVFVLNLLDKLSIPAEKATDVCMVEEREDCLLYDVSWRVAGRILSEPEEKKILNQPDMGGCGYCFSPDGPSDFPEPFFDLLFCLGLPWVMGGPQE